MTTYRTLKVGDKINICVSIGDFCGSYEKGLVFLSNDINLSPAPCTVEVRPSQCIRVEGIGIRVRFARTSGTVQCNSCQPEINYTEIGTLRTNANGNASIQYTITQKDLDDYKNAIASGSLYKLVTCINDPLGQQVIKLGTCSDPITVSPKECVPVWNCELPLNGYEADGCGNRRLNPICKDSGMHGMYVVKLKYWEIPFVHNSAETIINGIKTIWNQNASKMTGWEFREVTVDTVNKEITLKIEKVGSIEFVVAWGFILGFFIINPEIAVVLVALGLVGFVIYNATIEYMVEPAFKEAYKLGFDDAKAKIVDVVQKDPELSQSDKDKIIEEINKLEPNPDDIDKSWETYKDDTFNLIKDAVKVPTVTAPLFVIVDSEFETSGTGDPNYDVVIFRDDKFSIWDIFKGDPLAFLDDELVRTKTDADGKFTAKLTLTEQNASRIYAKTGGKESERRKVYALTEITIAMIIITLLTIAYLIYIRRKK